jgi:hypothetical protein
MPLKVTDLQRGDRVLLSCPESRVALRREAQFEGIFASVADQLERGNIQALLMGRDTADFLNGGKPWACFQFRAGTVCSFLVEADGDLRDQTGLRIFIEQRLGRVGMG